MIEPQTRGPSSAAGQAAAGPAEVLDAKPDLDMIEPRRIGRGEVQMHVGVRVEKFPHFGRFVRREVIQDDMDFLLRFTAGYHLVEEADKLITGVP